MVLSWRHAESAKRTLDQRQIEATGDEYQTRAAVRIGPSRQMPRRVDQMLHRMHRYQRRRIGDIENALNPQ